MKFALLTKVVSALALIVLALPATQAFAVINEPPPIALPTVGGGVADTEGFSGSAFSQLYTFSLGAGLFKATLLDNNTLHPFQSLMLEVKTGGGTLLGSVSAPNSSGFFTFTALAAGPFQAIISGTPTALIPPLSTYGFSISPIPEPEVWAMMLVGVGLVGFRLHQKNRKAKSLHFA